MLQAAYFVIRDSVPYKELGPDHFDCRDRKVVLQRLARRIEALGYQVQLRPAVSGVSISGVSS